MTESGLMNIPEAAAYIGVSDKTIRRYITHGLIACINISAGLRQARWAIRQRELDAFLEKRTAAPDDRRLMPLAPPLKTRRNAWLGCPTPPQGMGPDGLPNYRKAATSTANAQSKKRR